jgi:SAM-dependent methyltransferase
MSVSTNPNTPAHWNEIWAHDRQRPGSASWGKWYLLVKELNARVVVDVGCGVNSRHDMFRDVEQFIGVDYSSAAASVSQELRPWGTWLVGDAYHLPLADNCADVVMSHHTLEHLDDPQRAVLEMKRVTRPGGIYGFTVPFMCTHPEHVQLFDYNEAAKMLSDGFKDITACECCCYPNTCGTRRDVGDLTAIRRKPMTELKISALMMTWNSIAHIKTSLPCLRLFDEVLIFDQQSGDGTPQWATEYLTQVRVSHRIVNVGPMEDFGKRRNELIEDAAHPYFLFLDSDEVIHPDVYHWLRNLWTEPDFEEDRDVSIAFPRVTLASEDRYYSAWYPDFQLRAGRRGRLWYQGKIHEGGVFHRFIASPYLVANRGYILEDQNYEKIIRTQELFRDMGGLSLHQNFMCDDGEDIIQGLRKKVPTRLLTALPPHSTVPKDLVLWERASVKPQEVEV